MTAADRCGFPIRGTGAITGKGLTGIPDFSWGEQTDGRRLGLYEDYSKADFAETGWEQPVTYEPVPINEYRAMPPGFGRAWPGVNETKPPASGRL